MLRKIIALYWEAKRNQIIANRGFETKFSLFFILFFSIPLAFFLSYDYFRLFRSHNFPQNSDRS